MRTRKHLMDCLEKKEKSQFDSDQKPSTDEIFNHEEEKNGISVPQETQTSTLFTEDQSFWENLFKDFNNENLEVPLQDHSSTNEKDEFMIDISEYLSEEAMEWPLG
ncbi:unnamed protein product [Arabidopsis thaliana]|uniref:(thale cress) hypothetical protein n=1 Tax=Arabidopsis thaliana TaxID=3702 RepID=A0A7G2ENI0_ARATH|nr:unnamed protein product [Arabidopsis thaliana]